MGQTCLLKEDSKRKNELRVFTSIQPILCTLLERSSARRRTRFDIAPTSPCVLTSTGLRPSICSPMFHSHKTPVSCSAHPTAWQLNLGIIDNSANPSASPISLGIRNWYPLGLVSLIKMNPPSYWPLRQSTFYQKNMASCRKNLPGALKVQPDQAQDLSGFFLLCQISYAAFLAQYKHSLSPDPSHEPDQARSGNLDFCDALSSSPRLSLPFSIPRSKQGQFFM